MSFFEELKRRSVFKVGIAYIVVAWVIMQVADVILANIEMPDWVFGVVLLLLAIGFPLALFLAWAFELTPEGISRESEIVESASKTRNSGPTVNYLIIGVLVMVVVYFAIDRFRGDVISQPSSQTQISKPTVVVLPFEYSQDGLQTIADGVVDEITARLVRSPDLNVVARRSAFSFRGSNQDIPGIAKQLKSDLLIEGSVYREDDQLRFHIQMLDDQGQNLWAETYAENASGLMALFNRVAGSVSDRVTGKVSEPFGEGNSPAVNSLPDELFVQYLEAQLVLRQRTPNKRNKTAIDFIVAANGFETVTQAAPYFAEAWAGLAEAAFRISILPKLNFDQQQEARMWREKASHSADQGLLLEPRLPMALIVKAKLALLAGQWLEADRLFSQALQTASGDATILAQYAAFLYQAGYTNEALQTSRKAFRLDPFSPDAARMVAIGLLVNRDYPAAKEYADLSSQLSKTSENILLTTIHILQGNPRLAADLLEEIGWPDDYGRRKWFEPWIAAMEGSAPKEKVLQLLDEAAQAGNLEPVTAVGIYSILGEADLAIHAMREVGYMPYSTLWSPGFDDLRSHPDFGTLMEEFGLTRLWRERGTPHSCRYIDESYSCD